MNLQSVVVVFLRLMALDFLVRSVIVLAPQVLSFEAAYPRSPYDETFLLKALPWLILAALIVGACLLWALALPIARLVTRGVPKDLSLGALSLADCYSVAFMAVGLLYVVNRLPQALNWAYYLFKTEASGLGASQMTAPSGYGISQAFILLIIGTLLFVNSRKWAVALAQKQNASSPEIIPPGNRPG